MSQGLARDRLTWTAYAVLGWFAYLQAAPGLVVVHLREELGLSYWTGGLYVPAFAAGSTVAGLLSSRLERALGRRAALSGGVVLLAAAAVGLTIGGTPAATLVAVSVMGLGGGLLLATIQAALADHHGNLRAVALAEVNVAASCGYLLLVGTMSLTSALGAGWRTALLTSLVVPVLAWWHGRRLPLDTPSPPGGAGERSLPRAFWIATAIVFCTTAVEWSVTAWGATYAREVSDVSTETAVSMMAGYFGGFLAARVVGSRLALRHDPTRLLGWALALTAAGLAVVSMSQQPALTALGLVLLGTGIGNLFPMTLSAAVAVSPAQAGRASGRVVAASAGAVLLAPLTVGALADRTSLTTAVGVVPVLVVASAVGLVILRRTTSPVDARDPDAGSRPAG